MSARTVDLRDELFAKDELIRSLERQLTLKESRILELSSQLDKYKSILNQQGTGGRGYAASTASLCGTLAGLESEPCSGPRKRGIGISAEPQTFDKAGSIKLLERYPKCEA